MRRRTGAAIALSVLVLGACTGGTPAAAPPPPPGPTAAAPPTLRWALSDDPTSLDPARIVRGSEEVVIDALFDSLTRLTPDGRAVPSLATSWEVDETATRFVFTLDPEARWHDGTPVVAADVVRGLGRVVDATVARPSLHGSLLEDVDGYASARNGGDLRGVRAPDDATVEVVLAHPSPQLPVLLAHPALAPVPPMADDDEATFAQRPVGNGPFAMGDWVRNQFLRVEPAATHASEPAISELVFRIYGDDADGEIRWSDLTAGQVQVADVPQTHRDQLATAGQLVGHADLTTVMLASTDHPVLVDVRARRALSMLIDREGVAARTNGARLPADGLVPDQLLGARAVDCAWCEHRPATAARILDEAVADLEEDGVTVEPLRLLTTDDGVSAAIADELRSAFVPLSAILSIETVAPVDLPAAVEEAEHDLVLLAWTPMAPTAESFMTGLLGEGSLGAAVTGWQDPAFLGLLESIESTSDAEARSEQVAALEALAIDQAVAIPVHEAAATLVAAAEVSGLRVGPDGSVDLTTVSIGARPEGPAGTDGSG